MTYLPDPDLDTLEKAVEQARTQFDGHTKINIEDLGAMISEIRASRRRQEREEPQTEGRDAHAPEGQPVHAGWICVDFDGTLAKYDGWKGHEFESMGPPIRLMMDRVRAWIDEGRVVKIFTARAGIPEQIPAVRQWLERYGIGHLEITNIKDRFMHQLWDDRAIQVEINTGREICHRPPGEDGRSQA